MSHALPRPQNLRRSLTHAVSGLVALAVVQLAPDRAWLVMFAGAFALAAWAMETARRFSPAANQVIMRFFAPIAHRHEYERVNSGTWYATALLLLAVFCPPIACSLAVIVLGVADPVAGFVGRRWGSVRLSAGRSLEGSLGFVAAAGAAGLATTSVFYPELTGLQMLVVVGVASLVGAVAEVVSTKWDDNFAIPVAVALSVTWVGAGFGLA